MAADEQPDTIHIHPSLVKGATKVASAAVFSFLLPIPPSRLCLFVFRLNYLWKSLRSSKPSSFPPDLGLETDKSEMVGFHFWDSNPGQ